MGPTIQRLKVFQTRGSTRWLQGDFAVLSLPGSQHIPGSLKRAYRYWLPITASAAHPEGRALISDSVCG
jgi:hypothetical protein